MQEGGHLQRYGIPIKVIKPIHAPQRDHDVFIELANQLDLFRIGLLGEAIVPGVGIFDVLGLFLVGDRGDIVDVVVLVLGLDIVEVLWLVLGRHDGDGGVGCVSRIEVLCRLLLG